MTPAIHMRLWLQCGGALAARGCRDALPRKAAAMKDPDAADPRYAHYLGKALGHLLGGEFEAVLTACERAVRQATRYAGSAMGLSMREFRRPAGISASKPAGLTALGDWLRLHNRKRCHRRSHKPIAWEQASPTLSQA